MNSKIINSVDSNYTVQEQCTGQIIDIGGVWEIKCPQGCTCEIQKFSDLPLHQWTNMNRDKNRDEDQV